MLKVTAEKRVKSNMKAALWCIMVLAPFVAAARVVVNVRYVEEATGYATDPFTIFHFISVVVLAVLLLAISNLFELHYLSKDFDPTTGDYTPTNISPYSELIFNKTSAAVVFMSAFLGFAMITSFFLMVFNLFNSGVGAANKFVMLLMILFMALAGMYFIISATKSPSPYARGNACLSFAPILWSAMRIILSFMDTTRYINTTSRHFELLNAVAITVFFLYQARFTLPNYRYHRIGRLFAMGLGCILLIAASSIPSLISVAFYPYTVTISNENDIVFWALDIIVMFYIIVRLVRVASQVDRITVDDLMDYARGYTESAKKPAK